MWVRDFLVWLGATYPWWVILLVLILMGSAVMLLVAGQNRPGTEQATNRPETLPPLEPEGDPGPSLEPTTFFEEPNDRNAAYFRVLNDMFASVRASNSGQYFWGYRVVYPPARYDYGDVDLELEAEPRTVGAEVTRVRFSWLVVRRQPPLHQVVNLNPKGNADSVNPIDKRKVRVGQLRKEQSLEVVVLVVSEKKTLSDALKGHSFKDVFRLTVKPVGQPK